MGRSHFGKRSKLIYRKNRKYGKRKAREAIKKKQPPNPKGRRHGGKSSLELPTKGRGNGRYAYGGEDDEVTPVPEAKKLKRAGGTGTSSERQRGGDHQKSNILANVGGGSQGFRITPKHCRL